jgi:hypothetical protein
MNTDHDKRVKENFADALEKADTAEHAAWLAQACGNDADERDEVLFRQAPQRGQGPEARPGRRTN